MKPWKVILAALLIFSTGLVTGSLVTARVRPAARPPVGLPGLTQRIEMMRRMERQLDLSAEQRERIEAIFHDSHQRMKQLWEPLAPQVAEETRHVRDRIEAELTPAQKEKFEQLLKQRPRLPKLEGARPGRKREDSSGPNDPAPPAPQP